MLGIIKRCIFFGHLLILYQLMVKGQKSTTLTSLVGSIQSSITGPQQLFTWTIIPTIPVSRIQLIFQSIDIETAELSIGDTSVVNNGIYIWNCAGCGNYLPPPIFSTTGAIIITFNTAVANNFFPSYFTLQYIAIPINYYNIPNFVNITLNMGYSEITPIASQGKIPANSLQVWRINQNAKIVITFMFSKFQLMSNCQDTLTIYDSLNEKGHVLFNGCSYNQDPSEWIYSMTGTAYLVFQTGNQVSTSSFVITYYVNVPLFKCGSFVNPDYLTGTSMIITDGSSTGYLMRQGAMCNWNITVPRYARTISLIFTEVSLMYGSSVVVSDSNGVVLWNGVGIVLTIPPIITSSAPTLTVSYSSSSSNPVVYTGFLGDFFTNYVGSIGSGRKNSTLMMSSEIDLFPPGNGVTYTPGVNYTWTIKPSQLTGNVIFAFSELSLTNEGDQLFLYDGTNPIPSKLLGSFANQSLPPSNWFQTSGSSALLVYQSSSNSDAVGNFKISYYADGPNYHCGFIRNPALLTMSSWTITDGSQSTEIVYANQFCEWNIQPSNAAGIYLFFNRFGLFGGEINIYIGNVQSGVLYTTISQSNAVPSPIFLPYPSIGITFATSSSPIGYGFSLTYYSIATTDYSPPSLNIAPYSSIVSFPGNNVVNFVSAAVFSFQLSQSTSANLRNNTTLTWSVAPINGKGRIYFAITTLTLAACNEGALYFYDTSQTQILSNANLLWNFCADNNNYQELMTPYQWITTSANSAIMQYVAENVTTTNQQANNFDISYYIDGPAYHCGFIQNPVFVTAPSFILTDGSSSIDSMSPNQNCEWLIQPQIYNDYTTTTSQNDPESTFMTVIEFKSLNLVGGELYIYAKDNSDSLETNGAAEYSNITAKDTLIWSCLGCSTVPRPIILNSIETIYVKFTTSSATNLGNGFLFFYWTTPLDDWREPDDTTTVLEVPDGIQMNNSLANDTSAFYLTVTNDIYNLAFYPNNERTAVTSMSNNDIFDGRTAVSTEFQSISTPPSLCGVVTGLSTVDTVTNNLRPIEASLQEVNTYYYALTQSYQHYLKSNINSKNVISYVGSFGSSSTNSSTSQPSTDDDTQDFTMASVCKYWLKDDPLTSTDSKQGIVVSIHKLSLTINGRLRIYGGLKGNDHILFDSNKPPRLATYPLNVTMPCGTGLVILESNSTNKSTGAVDYGFSFTYHLVPNDEGQLCRAYYYSLYPPPKKADPYIPYYISAGVIGGVILAIAVFYFTLQLKKKRGYVFYPSNYKVAAAKPTTFLAVTPSHPKFNDTYNQLFNYFLPKGQCMICKTNPIAVLTLKCKHTICMEDCKGYILSALGDISMFPIKCPMHFDGCMAHIDANVARRVLTQVQYSRFNEFADRALYGDGMRCIFCNNYVCFPNDMSGMSQVECPYCIQKFCVKCKKPWHYNRKCPVDMIDASLEIWKKKSGAQTCPSCQKLIEKDDPDTWNHMVHKITDGIPCIRDRTDFCYLCGEEVTGDYPHEEVKHPGVNHFPEGVFQNCRRIIQKEKEKERELLRKQRRRRGNGRGMGNNSVIPSSAIMTDDGFVWDDLGTEETITPYDTPLLRPFGAPSTPQVIEFPLMEDNEFIAPAERNPANYSATIPFASQIGSNRTNNTTPIRESNDNNTGSLTMRSIPSTNNVAALGNLERLAMVDSPAFPAVPFNSTLTSPQRPSLPIRFSDNDDDQSVSALRVRSYEDFDEEWGTILQNGGVYPTPVNLSARNTSPINVNFSPTTTPMMTPISSPVRTSASDRASNRSVNFRNDNNNNNSNPPTINRPGNPTNVHLSIANGGRNRRSAIQNNNYGSPPLASRSMPASPLIPRHRFNSNT